MSAIKIVKGLPFSFLVKLLDDDTSVDLNDGTWMTSVSLRFQTKTGNTAFDIVPAELGNNLLVELTDEQTSSLNHLGSGYILVVNAAKDDDTVHIQNEIPVNVQDGL